MQPLYIIRLPFLYGYCRTYPPARRSHAAGASPARSLVAVQLREICGGQEPLVLCDTLVAARAMVSLRLGAPCEEVLALLAPPSGASSEPWRLWLQAQVHYFMGDLQAGVPYLCLIIAQLATLEFVLL
jgi:hypothetical protein